MYKQKGKALPDYKSESLIGSPNKLKPFVDVLSKRKHDTLLNLANKKETNVT
jgi:hypothetical protein